VIRMICKTIMYDLDLIENYPLQVVSFIGTHPTGTNSIKIL
jgi:hypothetical protein